MIMTTDVTIVASSWWRWWPTFVGGFCSPLLGLLLARWLPFHFAMGIAFFVVWFFAGLIFAGRSAPKWGIPRWLVAVFAGAGAGLTVAVVSFFFPWN
jgi:hypothetical protein